MKQKIVEMWYDDSKEANVHYGTGLFFRLEDGTILRQNTTDPVETYSSVAPHSN